MAWNDVVALMRGDIDRLGDDPQLSWRLVLRLYASIDALAHKLAPAIGVSPRELSALLALWNGGRCTMSELADRIGLSRAAVTAMCDRLERSGLLTRMPDPMDRRRVYLLITQHCDSQLEAAFAQLAAELEPIATTDEWRAFASTAAALRTKVHALAGRTHVERPSGETEQSPSAKRGPDPHPTHW